ncbi:Uncharacterised protein [Serratia fonticola]|uniref:Uncharacterized protein n=1 Tax=Serratia fonticola TaxID=47917 RepID=A0A4U9W5P6_SERFO|nr:Uncharacterised protein [Serratia fonticola]
MLPDKPRAAQVFAGTDNAYRLQKKYGVKVAFGTDVLSDANLATRQGSQLSTMMAVVHPSRSAQNGDG